MNPTAPGVPFSSYCFRSLLFLDLQIYKTTITLLQFSIVVSIFHLTVKGPLDHVGVWRFVFLCAGAEHVVLGESPSGSITLVLSRGKYFSACYIIPSSSGKKPTRARCFKVPSRKISGTVAGETSSTSTRFLITNLISSHLHYLPFVSRFHLPHFTNSPFYSPLFFVRLFLVRSLVCYLYLCYHVPSICLHLCLLKIY